MGNFGTGKGLELNMSNIFILTLITLVIVQGIGLLLNNLAGTSIFLGPTFILLSVVGAAAMAFIVIKKLMTNEYVTKQDMFAMLVVAAISFSIMFFLRGLVPEVFQQSFQSFVGN